MTDDLESAGVENGILISGQPSLRDGRDGKVTPKIRKKYYYCNLKQLLILSPYWKDWLCSQAFYPPRLRRVTSGGLIWENLLDATCR
jgi:hypothetical protein